MDEPARKEKERLYVLLARYQIGLLSDEEKEEMTTLQKKVYGDSTLYRDAEYERLACAPKKGDALPEAPEKDRPRIVAEKEGGAVAETETEDALFEEAPKKEKKKIDLDLEEL
ncbi:MAG: hypothetical protein NTY90_02940 [Candidatus Micrarchaeota archaeon]|nr:hypothetical protein [Candidatus Micrarchaeota archaeon]